MLVTINRKPELRFNQRGVIDPKKLLRCTTQKVIKRWNLQILNTVSIS